MNATAVAGPASRRTVAIRRPGCTASRGSPTSGPRPSRSSTDEHHAPQRRAPHPTLDQLEDALAEAEERHRARRTRRSSNPASSSAAVRARQRVGQRHDVVDHRAPRSGVRPASRGARRRGHDRRPSGPLGGQALDADARAAPAPGTMRMPPTAKSPVSKPSADQAGAGSGTEIWRACTGTSAIMTGIATPDPHVRARGTAAARPARAGPPPRLRVLGRRRHLAGRGGRRRVVGLPPAGAPPAAQHGRVAGRARRGAALRARDPRPRRALVPPARRRGRRIPPAATPRSSTSSATWATTSSPRAPATRSASC